MLDVQHRRRYSEFIAGTWDVRQSPQRTKGWTVPAKGMLTQEEIHLRGKEQPPGRHALCGPRRGQGPSHSEVDLLVQQSQLLFGQPTCHQTRQDRRQVQAILQAHQECDLPMGGMHAIYRKCQSPAALPKQVTLSIAKVVVIIGDLAWGASEGFKAWSDLFVGDKNLDMWIASTIA